MTNRRVRLSTDVLDNALDYIEATSASDFFPMPFEFEAIRSYWDSIRDALSRIDLLGYVATEPMRIFAPKHRSLVRPVDILDPIDSLLYTGLCLHLAPDIQERRDEYQDDVVFSWIYDKEALGTKDTFAGDWNEFAKIRTDKLEDNDFVATADIADFFWKVYQHKVENAVAAICDEYSARALKKMLNIWSDNHSYGIPIGPHASNIFAEAVLIQIDDILVQERTEFVRWNDDYFIFGSSEDECVAFLHKLGYRLYRYGLSLNQAKTRVLSTGKYFEEEERRYDPLDHIRDRIVEPVGKISQIRMRGLALRNKRINIDKVSITRFLVSTKSIPRCQYQIIFMPHPVLCLKSKRLFIHNSFMVYYRVEVLEYLFAG